MSECIFAGLKADPTGRLDNLVLVGVVIKDLIKPTCTGDSRVTVIDVKSQDIGEPKRKRGAFWQVAPLCRSRNFVWALTGLLISEIVNWQ